MKFWRTDVARLRVGAHTPTVEPSGVVGDEPERDAADVDVARRQKLGKGAQGRLVVADGAGAIVTPLPADQHERVFNKLEGRKTVGLGRVVLSLPGGEGCLNET